MTKYWQKRPHFYNTGEWHAEDTQPRQNQVITVRVLYLIVDNSISDMEMEIVPIIWIVENVKKIVLFAG